MLKVKRLSCTSDDLSFEHHTSCWVYQTLDGKGLALWSPVSPTGIRQCDAQNAKHCPLATGNNGPSYAALIFWSVADHIRHLVKTHKSWSETWNSMLKVTEWWLSISGHKYLMIAYIHHLVTCFILFRNRLGQWCLWHIIIYSWARMFSHLVSF